MDEEEDGSINEYCVRSPWRRGGHGKNYKPHKQPLAQPWEEEKHDTNQVEEEITK